MSERMIDYLGDEMPPGYEAWQCPICTAVCNFEAMMQCSGEKDCPVLTDPGIESNGGAFGFMRRAG